MSGSFLRSSTPRACRVAFTAAYGGRRRTTSTLYRNDYLSPPLKDSLPAKMKSSLRWTAADATKFEEQINVFVRVRLNIFLRSYWRILIWLAVVTANRKSAPTTF
jgi:hypothetical protein